jgi:hypothetical protein
MVRKKSFVLFRYSQFPVAFKRLIIRKSSNNGVLESMYRDADKSLAPPTSRCILFDGESISFDASLDIYTVLIFLQLWL